MVRLYNSHVLEIRILRKVYYTLITLSICTQQVIFIQMLFVFWALHPNTLGVHDFRAGRIYRYIYGKYKNIIMARRQVFAEPSVAIIVHVSCPVQHISLKLCQNSSKYYGVIIKSRRHPKMSPAFQQS